MAKNNLAVQGKQHTDVSDILKNPVQRDKLTNFVDEVVRCKMKILNENESIKTLRESAVEELGIKPKLFNYIVALYFNNNFEEKQEELEQLETVLHGLMQLDAKNQIAQSKDEEE